MQEIIGPWFDRAGAVDGTAVRPSGAGLSSFGELPR